MMTATNGPPGPRLQPFPCLGHSYCFYLIPWPIILEADSAFPLLTFVSPNAQHWKAPEGGISPSLPLASSMAATAGCSNGSHTGVIGEPGPAGPAVNSQWGTEGASQVLWRHRCRQLIQPLRTHSELPSPNPATLQLLYSLVELQSVAVSMTEYLVLR